MEFLRRRLGLIFRAVVSLLAVWYVIHTYDWVKVWANARTMDFRWLLVGVLCFIPTLIIVSWRWRMLLHVHNVRMRFWRVFELTMIGQFFSTVGVGTTGGDVFKIFYVTRAVPEGKTAVAFTVILDRVIGMLALLVFGVLLSCTRLDLLFFHTDAKVRLATGTFYVFAICGAIGAVVASFGPYFLNRPFFVSLGAKLPMAHRAKKLYAAYDKSARALGTNVVALLGSIPSHLAITMLGYCILLAMDLHPDLLAFGSTMVIVNLLIALPASISGIGIREILFPLYFAHFATPIPADKAGTFAITYFALNIVWNLFGGPFYFLYRHETHTPPPNVSEVEPILEQ